MALGAYNPRKSKVRMNCRRPVFLVVLSLSVGISAASATAEVGRLISASPCSSSAQLEHRSAFGTYRNTIAYSDHMSGLTCSLDESTHHDTSSDKTPPRTGPKTAATVKAVVTRLMYFARSTRGTISATIIRLSPNLPSFTTHGDQRD